jgi:predicted nuclease of predicted toxin-antitoxin system
MTFPVYLDENADAEIAERLVKAGVDALRCQEADMTGATDEEHLTFATRQGRVIVTRDQDFLKLNQQWLKEGRSHAGIIFITADHLDQVGLIVQKILGWQSNRIAEDMRDLVWFV